MLKRFLTPHSDERFITGLGTIFAIISLILAFVGVISKETMFAFNCGQLVTLFPAMWVVRTEEDDE